MNNTKNISYNKNIKKIFDKEGLNLLEDKN